MKRIVNKKKPLELIYLVNLKVTNYQYFHDHRIYVFYYDIVNN